MDALKISPPPDQAEPAYRRPKEKAMVLVTAHSENLAPYGADLQTLLLPQAPPGGRDRLPVHPNPSVSQKARDISEIKRIHLLPLRTTSPSSPARILYPVDRFRRFRKRLQPSASRSRHAKGHGAAGRGRHGYRQIGGTEPAVILEALEGSSEEHKKGNHPLQPLRRRPGQRKNRPGPGGILSLSFPQPPRI